MIDLTLPKYNCRYIPLIFILILFFKGCISPYEPDFKGEEGLLVVDGSLIKGRATQVVVISKTSPITLPEYLPVEDCNVSIMDNTGNTFVFDEESPGKYVATIDDAMLSYENQYKLVFTTPSGDVYESNYQEILETAPVDSIYSIHEYHYSPETERESNEGIQFYVDVDAPENASRYYRFVLEETWENLMYDDIWGVYDGQTIKRFYPADSLQHCWKTKDVTGLYSASTVLLSANRIKKIPLHFVDISSEKLNVKYCATIKQYALSAEAYDYWYEKERELKESGNIYAIQPSQPKSNIHNVNNTDELVMGFFWAASYSIKRAFVKSLEPKPLNVNGCAPSHLTYCPSEDFDVVTALLYEEVFNNPNTILPDPPMYINFKMGSQYTVFFSNQCIDCRIVAGDIHKPDFWE